MRFQKCGKAERIANGFNYYKIKLRNIVLESYLRNRQIKIAVIGSRTIRVIEEKEFLL